MHGDTHPELWLTKISVTLVLCGALFLTYGAVASTPALYGALLAPRMELQGNLLGFDGAAEIRAPHPSAPAVTPRVPQLLFFAGCLLVVSGACIDVRRRLRHLGHR